MRFPITLALPWRLAAARKLLPILFLGLAPSLAAAQVADVRKVQDNPEYAAWSKFPAGTTVQVRVNGRVETVTLLRVTPSTVRIDRGGDPNTVGSLAYRPGRQTVPAKIVVSGGGVAGPWEDRGDEGLQVGGRQIRCKVQKLERHDTGGPRGESHRVATRWLSPDVPGGIVKEDNRWWGSIGVKGTEMDITATIEMVDFKVPAAGEALPAGAGPLAAADIDALTRQLGVDSAAQRDRAEAALLAAGEPARARLKAGTVDLPPAGLDRANAIARQLSRRAPTRITLKLKDSTAREAFAALSRASGIEFRTRAPDLWKRAERKRVTLDADERPFWSVLKELESQTGIGLQWADRALRPAPVLTLTDDAKALSRAWATDASGQYLCVLQPANLWRDTARVSMTVVPEPRAWPVRRAMTPAIEEALDDKGNVLVPHVGAGGLEHLGDWSEVGPITAGFMELIGLDPAATRIATLQGNFRVEVQDEVRSAEFPDVLKAEGTTKKLDGRRLTVKSVDASRAADGVYALTVTLYRDDRDSLPRDLRVGWWQVDSMRQFPRERLTLRDANGRALLPADANGRDLEPVAKNSDPGHRSPDNSADFRFTFSRADAGQPQGPPGEPATLVWEVGKGDAAELVIPFTFADARPPAPAVRPAVKPPTKFTFNYKFEPSPGLRTWVKTGDDTWEERYATGQVTKFTVRRRIDEGDLRGTIVATSRESTFEVYIPDRGAGDWVRQRNGPDAKWGYLAKIETSE